MLVGRVVIDDQVHVKGLGHPGIDMAQKIEELLATMTAFAPVSPCFTNCLRQRPTVTWFNRNQAAQAPPFSIENA
jgi:hypothetical protein